jgi:hypothetical protein
VSFAVWRDPAPVTREKLAEALRLILRFAPAQAHRFHQLSRGIFVMRLHTADAAWRGDLSACLLDIEYLESDRASAPAVAATVIHELTHARLRRLGFVHTKERRVRLEHICHRAEKRFLSSLPESAERTGALAEIEERLGFDATFWSEDAGRAREEFFPWYIKTMRFISRHLQNI